MISKYCCSKKIITLSVVVFTTSLLTSPLHSEAFFSSVAERRAARLKRSAPPKPTNYNSQNFVFPIHRVPNWGAMRSPSQWTRTYSEMQPQDFVYVPEYDLRVLTQPISELMKPLYTQNIPKITAKLVYSTRHFGAYHLDSNEYVAPHPGIDIKLAEGTPIGVIGNGIVHRVARNERLGLHIVVQHLVDEEKYYSIYGHLHTASTARGKKVMAGDIIGTSGNSGISSSPHLHLQIDKGTNAREHIIYSPRTLPSAFERNKYTVHPIHFIHEH